MRRAATPVGTSDRIALIRMISVMHAVVLRDIRSRYFNHGLGFLMGPIMPVAHMLILLLIYSFTGRNAVFGEDLALFFATGLVPALTFSYISRYMSISVVANKNMLAFPAVKLIDIMLARSFLEIIGIVLATLFIGTILVATGSNVVPRSPEQALLAMACTAALSIGVGIIASVIAAIFPFFAMIYSLFMVVVYLSSNAPIYITSFPEEVIYFCSFNPVFHLVEWMRSAYYLGYPTQYLDKTYVMMWCILTLPIGLLLERLLRPQIMN
ncbi:capsular polysaccharide transport system permease protein [Ensifer sp. KUDG1]